MKKTSRIIAILAMLAILFTMAACGSEPAAASSSAGSSSASSSSSSASAPAATEADTYKIAVALALTGGSAEQGNEVRNAVKLAIDDVNAAGGINGKMVELVDYDDQADPKQAATVANAIAADESILAVVGHTNSSCTLAGAAIYNPAGIPQITCTSSSPKITDAGEYTFRLWNSDAYTAQVHVETIINKGYKNVGMIYENNDYGLGAYNVAVEKFKEAGIDILVAESYLLGETKDFTTILTKMKSAGVEAIFAVSDETELPMIMTQAHSLGFYPFVTSTGAYSTTVLTLGGAEVEGLYGATFFDPNNLPEGVAAFYDRFMETYGVDAVVSPAVSGYISGCILMDALKSGATTRDQIRDYLDSGLTFDTMVGTLQFDENGDVTIPLTRMVIKDGAFVGTPD
ncbi:MAG: ABC transporter substrate-binding protein [Oscillospiraceae bacterium]|nr:ABC transporter substrate-binding protein [Oscillospiraceae bacterium]